MDTCGPRTVTPADADTLPAIDSRSLRDSLGAFATGVCVVAARASDGRNLGVTVNSFCSVSLDPPLILVCIGRSLSSHDELLSCEGFTVSVLRDDQADLSAQFATRGGDKWDGVSHRPGLAGGLILEPHLACFDCVTHSRQDGGDHTILIGRVLDFTSHHGAPLLYFRGKYDTTVSSRGALNPDRGSKLSGACA